MQFTMKAAFGFGDRFFGVFRIGQVNLDVILGACLPWTVFRKRVPRAGDDAPSGCGKAFDRRVTDAAACSGEQQCAARLVAGCHGDYLNLTGIAASWSTALSGLCV